MPRAAVRQLPVTEIRRVSYFDDRCYRVTFVDGTSRYLWSVTTLLNASPKPYLARWRGQIGNDEADKIMHTAMDRGSRIHHANYLYTVGGWVIFDPPKYKGLTEMNIRADKAKAECRRLGYDYIVLTDQGEMQCHLRDVQWLNTLYPKGKAFGVIMSEFNLYSLKLNTAGTADRLLRIEEGSYNIAGSKPLVLPAGLYLSDMKTGKEDDDHWMQIVAYMMMYEESTGQQLTGGLLEYLDAETRSGIEGLTTRYKSREELVADYLPQFQATQFIWMKKFGNKYPTELEFPQISGRTEDFEEIQHGFTLENRTDKKLGVERKSTELVAQTPKEQIPTAAKEEAKPIELEAPKAEVDVDYLKPKKKGVKS